jgi:hypothetical protein
VFTFLRRFGKGRGFGGQQEIEQALQLLLVALQAEGQDVIRAERNQTDVIPYCSINSSQLLWPVPDA